MGMCIIRQCMRLAEPVLSLSSHSERTDEIDLYIATHLIA